MQIRLLNKDDIECWKELRLEALKNYPESFGSSYEEEINYTKSDWEKNLMNNHILGAFSGDLLIGSVGLFILNKIKTKHKGILFSMYVKPEFRKNNVADNLLKEIIKYAKGYVTQIHLACVTTNLTALRLYKKHGFEIYGTSPRAIKINGNFFNEYLMVLHLLPEDV